MKFGFKAQNSRYNLYCTTYVDLKNTLNKNTELFLKICFLNNKMDYTGRISTTQWYKKLFFYEIVKRDENIEISNVN